MKISELLNDPAILRLGALPPEDRRAINKLHGEGKPPGYIYGFIYADRKLRGYYDEDHKPRPVAGKSRTRKEKVQKRKPRQRLPKEDADGDGEQPAPATPE